MTQNLKIEVLTGDISIDGMVVTNLVTKEELSTAIVKKADLGTDGKIPTSQLPAEIVNTAGIVDEVKLQLETSIKDAVDESNAYAESYTDNALSSKADLTSGKVPLEQLPTIDQYPQFGTALSNLSTSILSATKQRTDQLEKTKADLGEDGKVLREQIPSYEKISGLPEQLEVMSTQTAAVSDELDQHKLQTSDRIDILKENIEENVQQLTNRQSHLMRTYVTKELGVDAKVGVKPGEYFYVRSTNEDEVLVEYENKGGGAVATGKSYPSSAFVQDVRVKAPHFFNTVLDMTSANNISDGMIVGTKGYYNIFDDGGAIYLISAEATDYSIPLARGLHAVFRDTFDIRKFGIRDDAALNQTKNLKRMVSYVDTREYTIDFHGFTIKSPDIPQFRTSGKANLNCLGFNYLHDIRNLTMVHDKTVQLQSGKCLLGFYPKSNLNGTFKLTNVKFDPWVSNHNFIDPITGTAVGEGDGSMHGFSTFPHPDFSNYSDYAESFTDISFELDNVEFLSNAVSYNIELARIPAKKVTLKNVKGDYLALMVHHYTRDLIAEDVHGVYRDDRRAAGRSLVTNLLHCEPAMVSGKNISINQHHIKNVSSILKSDGTPYRAYFYYAMGASTSIRRLLFDGVSGLVAANSTVSVNYPFVIKEFSILNSTEASFTGEFSADKVRLSKIISSSNIMPRWKVWADFEAIDCTLGVLFFDSTDTDLVEQGNFKFLNCKLTHSQGVGYSRNSNRWFNRIALLNCDYARNIIETGFGKLEVIGGQVATASENIGDAIAPTKVSSGVTRPSEIYIKDLMTTKPQLASTFFVKGTFAPDRPINLLAVNNVTISKLNWSGANVSAKSVGNVFADSVASVVYDPPSLAPAGTAGDITTTTVTVPGAVPGDFVQVTFNRYNSGVRIYPVVSAANTVTVEFRNMSAAPIDLASGTLAVKIV